MKFFLAAFTVINDDAANYITVVITMYVVVKIHGITHDSWAPAGALLVQHKQVVSLKSCM